MIPALMARDLLDWLSDRLNKAVPASSSILQAHNSTTYLLNPSFHPSFIPPISYPFFTAHFFFTHIPILQISIIPPFPLSILPMTPISSIHQTHRFTPTEPYAYSPSMFSTPLSSSQTHIPITKPT
ncbi:unnamed protein product, partial [Vitis vinifera]